jgi:hypothetical protein
MPDGTEDEKHMFEQNHTSGEPCAAVDRDEARTQSRRLCGRIVLVRPCGAPEAAFRLTSVLDLSSDGIGLLLARPSELGAVFEVRFRHPAVADRQAQVIHVAGKNGGWHIGCLLDRPFSDAEAEVVEVEPHSHFQPT